MIRHVISLLLALGSMLIILSCDSGNLLTDYAGLWDRPQFGVSTAVEARQTGSVEIRCYPHWDESESVAINWTCSDGVFVDGDTGVAVVWRAPMYDGRFWITITASDGITVPSSMTYSILVSGEGVPIVYGRVFDARDSSAVLGASVCYDTFCGTTDVLGQFRCDSVGVGTSIVTVSADGFATTVDTIAVYDGRQYRFFYLDQST